MGSVIVTFKIMPIDVETDMNKLERTLKKEFNPQRLEIIPVAFGLNAIEMKKLVEEKEGEMDRIMNAIKQIKGVKEVEVLSLTRSL